MKNFKRITQFLLISALFSFGYAQEAEEEPAPTFAVAGSVDTYYRSTTTAPNSSFANLPGFAMGMTNIIMSYEGEKSGFVADLVYGPRGADAVFNSTGSANIVNQLYVYYNVSDSFTLTLGNFNTFLGYEVISPVANFNYSTSYMFSYGPFSHAGIKADFALSENTSLMFAIMNDTDYTEFQNVNPLTGDMNDYTFGAQLGLYGQYINFISGDGYSHIDFTGGIDISESFFLGVNATSYSADNNAGSFSGVALYPQLALSDSFTIGARYEAFSETDGGVGAIDPSDDNGVNLFSKSDYDNTSFTITGSYTSGNFIFKPEFRVDTASDPVYPDGLLKYSDNIASFVVAAIYSF
tara:strand:+ start:426 stop:1481 length:1056 start_codon:yes stop_codon:yes gene_type:complete